MEHRLDALLFSDWQVVLPETINDGCPPDSEAYLIHSFHPRDRASLIADREKQIHALKDLSERFTLAIQSAVERVRKNPGRGLVSAYHTPLYGVVYGMHTRSMVYVMMEIITPLLRDDLTVSERLAQQFLLAQTVSSSCRLDEREANELFGKILHETIVSFTLECPMNGIEFTLSRSTRLDLTLRF